MNLERVLPSGLRSSVRPWPFFAFGCQACLLWTHFRPGDIELSRPIVKGDYVAISAGHLVDDPRVQAGVRPLHDDAVPRPVEHFQWSKKKAV